MFGRERKIPYLCITEKETIKGISNTIEYSLQQIKYKIVNKI